MRLLENIRRFICAGHAIFTIKNSITGNRFTYKVMKPKKRKKKDKEKVLFVSVLHGCNNECMYDYIGCIFNDEVFRWTSKSKVDKSAKEFQAFDWLWRNADKLPENAEFWHEGYCGHCGKLLTVPESIELGYGPCCMKLLGIKRPKKERKKRSKKA